MSHSIEKAKTWEQIESLSVDLTRSVAQRKNEDIKELIVVLGLLVEHLDVE